MPKGYNLSDEPMLKGVDVRDTKMLSTEARENTMMQSGASNLTKDFKKAGSFGNLGSRGYGANGKMGK
jgi:hypothetical protein